MGNDKKLYERDWVFILESIYDINATNNIKDFELSVLDLMDFLIGADQSMFTLYGEGSTRTKPTIADVEVIGEPARFIDKFREDPEYYGNRFFRTSQYDRKTSVYRDTDMFPDTVRLNTPIYRDIYSPQGIYYALRARLAANRKIAAEVSLFNSRQSGNFSERDVILLEKIAPHLALKLGYLLERARQEPPAPQPHEELFERYDLTDREKEVAELLLRGLANEDIADELVISTSTLKKHIYNIYRKLDVNNRAQFSAKVAKDESA